MKLKQDRKITIEVTTRITCDVCGKTTNNPSDNSFYSFDSHHDDWGNDSIESYHYHDVCSSGCYLALLKQLSDDNLEYQSFMADGKKHEFIQGL